VTGEKTRSDYKINKSKSELSASDEAIPGENKSASNYIFLIRQLPRSSQKVVP
jgi:hypothetical protein